MSLAFIKANKTNIAFSSKPTRKTKPNPRSYSKEQTSNMDKIVQIIHGDFKIVVKKTNKIL